MNKADGGNRKFILIEMMDYADSITAERVKRVIQGYGEDKKAVPGTGGSFSYYELGKPLINGDNLNEEVGLDKIREYIWYTETKADLREPDADKPYYLGSSKHTAYYFFYKPDKVCVLNHEFLSTITVKQDNYVIYADPEKHPEYGRFLYLRQLYENSAGTVITNTKPKEKVEPRLHFLFFRP